MWQTGIFSTSPTLVVNCPTRGIIGAHCDKKFHFCSKIQFWQSKQKIFTWKIQKNLAPSLFWYFWGLPEMLISLADFRLLRNKNRLKCFNVWIFVNLIFELWWNFAPLCFGSFLGSFSFSSGRRIGSRAALASSHITSARFMATWPLPSAAASSMCWVLSANALYH